MSRRGRFDCNHHVYKYSVDRRALIREKAQARCRGGEGFDYNHHAYKYSVDRRALIREKAQARCQGGEGLITIIMPTNTLLIVGHSFVKRLHQDVKAGKV